MDTEARRPAVLALGALGRGCPFIVRSYCGRHASHGFYYITTSRGCVWGRQLEPHGSSCHPLSLRSALKKRSSDCHHQQ